MQKIKLYTSISLLYLLLIACQNDQKKTAEAPVKKSLVDKVTTTDVEIGIRNHIEEATKAGNGTFSFYNDSVQLSLKLVRVHTEYLSVLSTDEFFACVDLATEDGDVYDVDFFMKGTQTDMQVTKTNVHKLNGKPYYTWKQAKDKTWFTVPVKNASNDLLGVIEGKDEFSFQYEVKLPQLAGPARMWIPIAQSDRFQTIEILAIEAPGTYEIIKEKEYENKILFLDLLPEHSQGEISIRYQVSRIEKPAYRQTNNDISKYLAAAPFLPVGNRFGTIANEVIQKKKANTPLTKARALYDYIIEEMRYAKQGVYGTGDANYACDSKSGNCTEFHSFFISLARSAGIPARFAVGAAIPSERNEGGVNGYHCWAEFYADGSWWPVDISEANKYSALATYYFGHHPANRIELSRGRNITPDPSPQSGPINFLAYPILEVEGKPDLPKTTFTFTRKQKEI